MFRLLDYIYIWQTLLSKATNERQSKSHIGQREALENKFHVSPATSATSFQVTSVF